MHSPTHRRGTLRSAVIVAALALSIAPATTSAATGAGAMTVIVRMTPGGRDTGLDSVSRLGGRVERRIGLIDAVSAVVPERSISALRQAPGVASVTVNTSVQLASATGADGYPIDDLGSLDAIREMIGAETYWAHGYTGQGVDVALLDSGVVPVRGLKGNGKIVNGADLSFESQDPDLRYLDTFGHGTHMAGIIAGRDPASAGVHGFNGIAPGARILSVKVADAFGTTDLVQVLAAIDWIVEHRRDNDLDVRVLNLSFGTDATQTYLLDPLAFAVEQAWRKGIFVVVAAGNEGYGNARLNDPAYDPFVMAVGASDHQGTLDRADDTVASFSSRGVPGRRPDILAPGRSVISLRDHGSYVDHAYKSARVGVRPKRFFRGSGTSQAAAVVSGAAALVIDQRPSISPDQLKRLLMNTAYELPGGDPAQGAGLIDLTEAYRARTPLSLLSLQLWIPSTGLGSLELSRGSLHLSSAGVRLEGEIDIFGQHLEISLWAILSGQGDAWEDDQWLGRSWTGDCWCTGSWAGWSWTGRSWTSDSWSGRSWTSAAWSGRSWTSSGWSGRSWTGRSWTTGTWHGDTWSSAGWGP